MPDVVRGLVPDWREEACLMLSGSWFQTGGPWYKTVRWPVDFVWTEGIGNGRVSEDE